MHLANQSSGKPGHTIPEFTKVDKLSHSSIGGTLDIREAHRLQEMNQPGRTREDSQRQGNARSKEQSDSR